MYQEEMVLILNHLKMEIKTISMNLYSKVQLFLT